MMGRMFSGLGHPILGVPVLTHPKVWTERVDFDQEDADKTQLILRIQHITYIYIYIKPQKLYVCTVSTTIYDLSQKRSSLYGTRGSHIWLPKSTRQGVIKVQWFSQRTMSQLARFDIGGYVHESSPLVINSPPWVTINHWLVYLPLWKYDFVSWDDEIPN